jgi:hypothetical protein
MRHSDIGGRALGMMQRLMTDFANQRASEVGPNRDVVTRQDAADALLLATAAIDYWGQGSLPPTEDQFKSAMQMLMVARDYVLPLPPTGTATTDELLARDLREAVNAIRRARSGEDSSLLTPTPEPRRGTTMDQYDAYIVHAHEDLEFATALSQLLTAQGFVVWFNSFIPGGHIRRQMEDGLRTSTFGIVIVSANLFQKKWALEEVDALFTLESLDNTRILPVWLGVSAEEVQRASPMLASRAAITRPDVEGVAEEVAEVIVERTMHRSPAQWLRSVVGGGISWYTRPSWLGRSLRRYDNSFGEFSPAKVARYPEPAAAFAEGRDLLEVLSAPVMHDGTVHTVIGHQDEPTRQVLQRHFTLSQELGRASDPARLGDMVSYVFQMRSVNFAAGQLAYVHCIGPYLPGREPWARPGELCWVTGLPIAYGAVNMSDGTVGQCVYLTARSVCFTPRMSSEGEFRPAEDPPS